MPQTHRVGRRLGAVAGAPHPLASGLPLVPLDGLQHGLVTCRSLQDCDLLRRPGRAHRVSQDALRGPNS